MEEQKKNKTINMSINKEEKQKLSYEQLNDACNQLFQQNKQLSLRNRELEQFIMNKRIEYLFKVMEFSKLFHSDFVVSCVEELEDVLKLSQSEEVEKGE